MDTTNKAEKPAAAVANNKQEESDEECVVAAVAAVGDVVIQEGMVSKVLHEAILAKEKERYEELHLMLSSEIERLKKENERLSGGELYSAKRPGSKVGRPKKKRNTDGQAIEIPRKVPNKQDEKWNAHFDELVKYKEKYGDCNVAISGKKNGSDEVYKKLGQFVSDQRTYHRYVREGKPSSLTPERIRRLTEIGFSWTVATVKPTDWQVRIQQLADYKAQFGHCNVPQKCTLYPGLGNFCLEQRRRHKAFTNNTSPKTKSLTLERMAELESMGFQWSIRNRREAPWKGNKKDKESAASGKEDAASAAAAKEEPKPNPATTAV